MTTRMAALEEIKQHLVAAQDIAESFAGAAAPAAWPDLEVLLHLAHRETTQEIKKLTDAGIPRGGGRVER